MITTKIYVNLYVVITPFNCMFIYSWKCMNCKKNKRIVKSNLLASLSVYYHLYIYKLSTLVLWNWLNELQVQYKKIIFISVDFPVYSFWLGNPDFIKYLFVIYHLLTKRTKCVAAIWNHVSLQFAVRRDVAVLSGVV